MSSRFANALGAVLAAGSVSLVASASSTQPPEGVSLVNLAVAGEGSVVAQNNAYDANKYRAEHLFDGSTSGEGTRWLAKKAAAEPYTYVVYGFNRATTVNAYRFWNGGSGGSSQADRAPKVWKLYGSSDTETWTELDAQAGETGWSSGMVRYYAFENATPYSYYKFVFEDTVNNSLIQLHEIELYHVTSFSLADCAAVRDASGGYAFSATVTRGPADEVFAEAMLDDGTGVVSQSLGAAVDQDASVSGTLTGLAADKTYRLSVRAVQGADALVEQLQNVYSGTLSLAHGVDAQELGCVPGTVVVTRAEASQLPLTVNYTLTDGTATVGRDYVAGTGSVVIPAGETSATISVVPIVNPDIAEDTSLTVSIAAGDYGVPAAGVALTIVNASVPSDANVWIASSASDGLASTAANWSKGMPTASSPETLKILVDGNYSSHDLAWDATPENGLAMTVSEWKQSAEYAGTVTVMTTYASDVFPVLTVNGKCELLGGTVTHPVSLYQTSGDVYSLEQMRTLAQYRLRMDVKGDLTIAGTAAVTADAKGYHRNMTGSNFAGSYGGQRNGATVSAYGDPKEPVDIAYGVSNGTDNLGKTAAGGGAVYLTVGGTATVNGTVSANGEPNGTGGSSAGSVYLKANRIEGTGALRANGLKPTSDKEAGAGGRVAVVSDTTIADTLVCEATSGSAYYSGCGTVYKRDRNSTYGTLYVVDNLSTQIGWNSKTPVTDEGDWTFDAVVIGNCGRLEVGEGRTLTLPNGLASVSSTASTAVYCGIRVDGGTVDYGTGAQTMSGKWTFHSVRPYTFSDSLTLTDGARLGSIRYLQSGISDMLKCEYAVNGNLTVDASSSVDVSQIYHSSGASETTGYAHAAHGGWSRYDNSAKGYPMSSETYGSVFRPQDPGTSPSKGYYGSGVLKLTVTGDLALDGTIGAFGARSDSTTDNVPAAPGGSIDVTAKSLSGTGSISADGACGRWNYAGGAGGGRVAVRLTGPGSDFGSFDAAKISARGSLGYAFNAKSVKMGSAGSVYLQTAAEQEKGGTLVVANDNVAFSSYTEFLATGRSFPTTPIVAKGVNKDDAADFKNVALVVCDTAVAEVSAPNLRMRSVDVSEGSRLDLAGNVLTVGSARVAGSKLLPGTYTAESAGLSDCLVGEGSLVVSGGGMVMIVR